MSEYRIIKRSRKWHLIVDGTQIYAGSKAGLTRKLAERLNVAHASLAGRIYDGAVIRHPSRYGGHHG